MTLRQDLHPDLLPAYRERGKEGRRVVVLEKGAWVCRG